MNRPFAVDSSTCARVASQSCGNSCHSSIRCGEAPGKALSTSSSTSFRFWKFPAGSATSNSLSARRRAVHVFPHHFGPSTQTAPNALSNDSSFLSAIRGLYPGISILRSPTAR